MSTENLIRKLRKEFPTGPGNRVVCATLDEAADTIEALETQLAAAKKALARSAYGFDQIQKSLMSNGPKQASGEVTAFFLAETNAALEASHGE